MAGTIGDFTITLPTVGQVTWGGLLNTALQQLADAIGAGVTVDGLDIQGDIDMVVHALIKVSSLRLSNGVDDGSAGSFFLNPDGELCVRDGSGNLVQLTSGGFIDVSGTGGIGGDYAGGNPNGASYSTATGTFTFVTSTGDPAKVDCGDISLGQGSDPDRVTLQCPTSLASSYTMRLPTAVPSGLALMTMDATGSVHHTTRPGVLDVTASLGMRVRDIDLTRDISIGGRQTVSGTYSYIRRDRYIGPHNFVNNFGFNWAYVQQWWARSGGGSTGSIDIPLSQYFDPGTRIWSVEVGTQQDTGLDCHCTATLHLVDPGIGSASPINHYIGIQKGTAFGAGSTSFNITNASAFTQLPILVPDTGSLFVRFTTDATAAGTKDQTVQSCRVVYDRGVVTGTLHINF